MRQVSHFAVGSLIFCLAVATSKAETISLISRSVSITTPASDIYLTWGGAGSGVGNYGLELDVDAIWSYGNWGTTFTYSSRPTTLATWTWTWQWIPTSLTDTPAPGAHTVLFKNSAGNNEGQSQVYASATLYDVESGSYSAKTQVSSDSSPLYSALAYEPYGTEYITNQTPTGTWDQGGVVAMTVVFSKVGLNWYGTSTFYDASEITSFDASFSNSTPEFSAYGGEARIKQQYLPYSVAGYVLPSYP